MTRLLDTAEVATMFGMSELFVRDHAAEMGGIRLGGRYGPLRFEEERVREYIEEHRLRQAPASKRRSGGRRAAGGIDLLPLPKEAA